MNHSSLVVRVNIVPSVLDGVWTVLSALMWPLCVWG